ncbi:carbohydrate sulfotransferase 1-like [Sinocyclocheilus anshuiensis]|uniref:Sulfotransferase n=1 Tax=Sinocyclocheilus anshuiensis TaxID=1608454 RepID=A0A671T067_9TELE|nr:PREDICTED: carbohydrate sulfotransferase 1-like [Sinocyclocheilus anshuiensis]
MWCSRKTVILLALVSIPIQYTVMKIFIDFYVHKCLFPNFLNCGLGQDVKSFDWMCDEYPYFSCNSSRKTNILILATPRSGSSFFGQLFNQHSDVFYLFEPLYHVQIILMPHATPRRCAVEHRLMLEASRDLLRSLYNCDFYFLESYIMPRPANHTTDKLFRRGASKALCSMPVCDAFSPSDGNIEEGDCVRKCASLNLTLATESCREKQHVAIKTVRIPELSDLKALIKDPRLNLKVIQLVRDPCGILSSRIETFHDTYCLWQIWRDTGRKPYNLDVTYLTTMCTDFLNSVSTGLSRPPWLHGWYMLVRYEDLARNPLQKSKEVYKFLGLSMERNVVDWIHNNTEGNNNESAVHKYGTLRDSAANAESWRLNLSNDMVNYTQTVCKHILDELGYKAVNSPEDLKNMSLSLTEDKTLIPFL